MRTCQQTMQREYVVFNIDRKSTVAQRVRVASTSSARRKGLLGIDRLPTGGGLWIAPCEAIHTFGMKIPVDAIFLDDRLQVRKLRPELRPSRVSFCVSAASVLEVAAGTVALTGTAVGDRLSFEPVTRSEPLATFSR